MSNALWDPPLGGTRRLLWHSAKDGPRRRTPDEQAEKVRRRARKVKRRRDAAKRRKARAA